MEINEAIVRQMDEENKRRLTNLELGQTRMGDTLIQMNETLTRIDERHKIHSDIPERLAGLEKDRDKFKGAAAIITFLLGGMEVIIEWLRRH